MDFNICSSQWCLELSTWKNRIQAQGTHVLRGPFYLLGSEVRDQAISFFLGQHNQNWMEPIFKTLCIRTSVDDPYMTINVAQIGSCPRFSHGASLLPIISFQSNFQYCQSESFDFTLIIFHRVGQIKGFVGRSILDSLMQKINFF